MHCTQFPYNWIKESDASYFLHKDEEQTVSLDTGDMYVVVFFLHILLLEEFALLFREMAIVIFVFTSNL